MVVGLWCAHPDYNRRPTIHKRSVFCASNSSPALPPNMPELILIVEIIRIYLRSSAMYRYKAIVPIFGATSSPRARADDARLRHRGAGEALIAAAPGAGRAQRAVAGRVGGGSGERRRKGRDVGSATATRRSDGGMARGLGGGGERRRARRGASHEEGDDRGLLDLELDEELAPPLQLW
ncbi:hypothetical protein ACMD2_21288 [Ananas comosus]|uniref:Uncharacterized protein n=1 Tax=Ananas comosus TaxID=4615 RepID=A0A199W3T8_ANACO|nr:hypothetical protein ACMD2_21288 [Ananas comosus]